MSLMVEKQPNNNLSKKPEVGALIKVLSSETKDKKIIACGLILSVKDAVIFVKEEEMTRSGQWIKIFVLSDFTAFPKKINAFYYSASNQALFHNGWQIFRSAKIEFVSPCLK